MARGVPRTIAPGVIEHPHIYAMGIESANPPIPPEAPSCISAKQWRVWYMTAATLARQKCKPVPSYCADCNSEYQGRMMAEGKCERTTP